MRLICPNCATEYEVDDSMIPAGGRDVQCSNCMETWFHHSSNQVEPVAVPKDLTAPPPTTPSPEPTTQTAYVDDDDEDGLSDGVPAAAIAALAEKRSSAKIDPSALDVIHEEVAREQSAREADAVEIETQIDLGLDEQDSSNLSTSDEHEYAQTEVVSEQVEVEEQLPPPPARPRRQPREVISKKRELLPDIEEINTALVEAPDPDELDEGIDGAPSRSSKARRRSGFRLGFGLMLMVSAGIVGLYVYAPAFAQKAPSLADALRSYVLNMDDLRVWLDGSAQDLVDQITILLTTAQAD
ncbi:MAG: zinc-ribbon domain-containing protein [Litoreibacter sp.]